MFRSLCVATCILIAVSALPDARAQSIQSYQTTPDLLMTLSLRATLHFSSKPTTSVKITVDDTQRFQQIDGFGASLTDAAAWLFAKKTTPAQTEEAFKMLFSRKSGIAVSFLRQPLGSSDLAATFYSYDDLCEQTTTACTTPEGLTDLQLKHFSLKHDEEYILPQLRKALAINPALRVMVTPWSAPGWMKTNRSMLGANPETKDTASLKPEFYPAFAQYMVKSIQGYQAAGVPIYALTVENEPLYGPPTYSGMKMEANEQAEFFGKYLEPALEEAKLAPKVMAYDHNWDKPEYTETVLRDAKAGALAAGTAWHHYGGNPEVMTKNHEEFPQKDQWVTESSGGTWQKGNPLTEEAAELVAVMRNWSKSYILWALATDQNHGPHVGGCGTCRGLLTIDISGTTARIQPEADYYVLGHASKFLMPGAVRIASDELVGGALKNVAFRNPSGEIVLYVVNHGTKSEQFQIHFHNKNAETVLPAGSIATFLWKP